MQEIRIRRVDFTAQSGVPQQNSCVFETCARIAPVDRMLAGPRA
jgi:hypothetical protein